MKNIDKYLFQAMDNYPYWLEGTIESLDYALSYDENSTMALCLAGRIQAEQLLNYEQAKCYFQKALSINVHALEVYPHFIQTLLWNDDLDEAKKLIAFTLTVKGVSKIDILLKKIQLLELQFKIKKALKIILEIKRLTTNNDYQSTIEDTKKRLKDKLKQNKTRK
ncbi:hypothetical protein FLBR109950_10235 [Flavobacterium branchiophilum]|uniref:Tetratricopeptide repeat protein n=1 Tax=Flavobacterium branchiophilum (strain FL-15) TaxID=1034807 RepID=G2Z7M4_FLABF|nr:hypothetical protein [Flavobacterium branchiophilum]CCB69144.1 Hypothetical protein FBFL15_1053 [Flavobacterium branchiophilum FL-15]